MRVILNHVRIKYEMFGRGPAVLFISDHQHDNQLWNPLAGPLIASNYRVLLVEVDSRGNEENAATAIITLLNSLGIGRAALCGLEQGKLLQQLLSDFPQRVACTFEANTPSHAETSSPRELDNVEEINRKLLDYLNGYAPRKISQATAAMASAA